jgi:sensor histidine kinase YesM
MKKPWYSKKWTVVLLHIAAWAIFFTLPYLLRGPLDNPRPEDARKENFSIVFSIIMDLAWMGFFYLNAFVLIPKLVYQKKFWLYSFFLVLILSWVIFQGWSIYSAFGNPDFRLRQFFFFNFFIFIFFLATSTAYQLIKDRMAMDKRVNERERENLKTELSLLRSQVSPHFMFNVLNNIVSLSRKQPDQVEPSHIKLSSLMRYMLYEADETKVPLEKEIEYLQSYIDLQKQRFGKKLTVNTCFNQVENQYLIEPMLLIPFVENAFKHGTGLITQPQIDIELKAKGKDLQFTVKNKYNDGTEEIKDKTSGIGLTNVQRRLDLLYDRQHSLLISKKEDWFIVSLQIHLN